MCLSLVILIAISGVIADPVSAFHAALGPGTRKSTTGISLTRSTTRPHWACPAGACEAIINPRPVRAQGGFALPGKQALLEGSGELGGYDPKDLQSAYNIPSGVATTQTIALVDAFGYPNAESDLAKYRERYGLAPCTKANGCFRRVNESGEEANYPKANSLTQEEGWQGESALDLDMASAACPECHLVLVESNRESVRDLSEANIAAFKLGATEISNSWGLAENDSECGLLGCSEYREHFHHPGVVTTAAAGDTGYADEYSRGASPEFPASSPYVVAVGGTSLHKATNARGWSENVWNEPLHAVGTGSGCSLFEPKSSWQTDAACTNRTDNDVAAVAAVATPVSMYITPEGWAVAGGTSASAPLVAGIMAHASESTRSLEGGYAFYQDPGSLFDVTSGNNGSCTPPALDEYLCNAGMGYDGPSGLGTPDGVPTVQPLAVTAVEPHEGPEAGLTSVTITGSSFTGATAVKFGSAAATSFTVSSSGQIRASSPAGSGTVDVTVTTPAGTSANNPADKFTYIKQPAPAISGINPSSGPAAGGTKLTITGSNFTGATAVKFGSAAATSFTVSSSGQITATSPAGSGTVDVTVTTPAGTSATRLADWFTYLHAAATCALRPQSVRFGVGESSKKGKQGNRRKAGTVALIAICNQNDNGSLNGAIRLVGKKGKHGKQRTKVFQLGAVHAALKAGVATGVKMQLPAALVLAVRPGTKGSAAFTLTASNANGTSGATARIPSLKL